ncbi:2-oxoglutarate dehydrogenase E1 component [Paenibacillus phyllosphaerae]|uniref:2-oxoglutarate dehydrogenase E1 component n=1 Tax=Paenibacillus phyllosphaerae TaxID=274593 RepID=A0A7W5FNQ9_9BACL|nr:2-oxoglutarate dehydrogenase E1 component [Paenibacillus phyllosphaerae]MBB3111269.1 2-oxoglutarate dehydrogenase E1 component [Paenibacillus phyllosphaerae]
MTVNSSNRQSPWQLYYGPNMGYIQEQYELYTKDPAAVDASYQEMFKQWGPPPADEGVQVSAAGTVPATAASAVPDPAYIKKLVDAGKLVVNIRTYGHLAANIYPLGNDTATDTRLLEPETYNLTREDLMAFPATLIWEDAPESVKNGWDAIQELKRVYTQSFAFEFGHVHAEDERTWLNRQAESGMAGKPLTTKERIDLLKRLFEVENFETFLHRTFVGQKRFSVEGNDVLIPMLDEIVREVAHDGAKNILMGMAHRGRLNVLAHVLGKPYSKIFSEFLHAPHKEPSEGSAGINFGWMGDVKYHLGAHRSIKAGETIETRITLANNPSHLEYVNPVVQGFTRAAQDDRTKAGYPEADFGAAACVVMHGDAAFAGEGIVAESLNFKKLIGYENGGTLHIIVNNRIGFTTESSDSRSTYYASDLAKGFNIPIVHVNADDPEACLAVIRMACEYRQKFKKDFLIDLVGYRRHGHNENDDPDVTQPLLYRKLRNHPTVSNLYAESLKTRGFIDADSVERLKAEVVSVLQASLDEAKKAGEAAAGTKPAPANTPETTVRRRSATTTTSVPLPNLKAINDAMLKWPASFNIYSKLERILKRRATMLDEGGKVDWGHAEALAFATILADGKPIRLSGQDSERGTFAHRNIVMHDTQTGESYCSLHTIPQARATFAVYNSPLSEESVLGFEYGYNVYSPETLTIWEAQFGDFANAAQVVFDQFISSGRDKWSEYSSLVMLLPHGYEGQGPEHSSARLERFLQMSANDNWTVANLSSAAQYFHLLRRQAALSDTVDAKPLIMMSPKSLLRNPRVASDPSQFSEGSFQLVLEQPGLGTKPEAVERLIFCSGKVAIDLDTAIETIQDDLSWVHIARIEQLYPFPKVEVERIISRFPNLKEIVWVQEEPQNMGAWNYMQPRLNARAPKGVSVRYNGRPKRSSPATGFSEVHQAEHQRLVAGAFDRGTLVSPDKSMEPQRVR